MKLRYFTIAAAAIAFAACTDDLGLGGFANDSNAVRIRATVGEPFGRSNPVGDATTVKQFNADDRMTVSSNNQSAVYEFDGTSWTPVDESNYLTWSSNKQNFTAYYPDTYNGSGNVPQKQDTEELIAAADYMKFDGELEMQNPVSFTMSRQTARVIINKEFSWNKEYKEGTASTHQVDAIKVNCVGVSGIEPYQPANYYALVNPGSADPDATFLTIIVSSIEGQQGTPVTHTVKGIPEFEPGYSYEYHITIGKSGVTISDVTVEDWSTGSILPGEGSADDNFEPMFFFREEIKDNKVNFSYAGEIKNLEIASYVRMGNVSFVPIPWTARFVRKLQDGTYQEIKQGEADYPTWISDFTDKGIGDNTDNLCTITAAPAEVSNNHLTALKQATPVNGYNLSNKTGAATIENTANCYIINAAGSYSFPLVYGNAIKNGAKNEAAYKSTATGKNVLENMVNHKNEAITSPYIASHSGCTPKDAVLVWQDAPDLVSNIQFVDGGSPEAHRITFNVSQSTIKQGNAIIAVRDADKNILWSWHIWITDYKPLLDATITNSYDPTVTQRDKKIWNFDNQHSYTMMGVPLGWCDAASAEGHEVIMQFIQTETGKTLEVTIMQEPLSVGGNCTYYQWGRKDPMLGSNGLGNVDKTYYSGGEYSFTKDGPGKVSVGVAIQNPHVYYNYGGSGYFDWCSNSGTIDGKSFLFNLWDTHNTSKGGIKYNITTKTVYDPSPVGYVVPPNGAMNSLTHDGTNPDDGWTYRNQFNTPFTSSEELNAVNGWVFYCKGMNKQEGNWDDSGGVIYYPAVGIRDYTKKGGLNNVGTIGWYWAAVPFTDAIAYIIAFNISTVTVYGDMMTYRILGMPVRPIREQ